MSTTEMIASELTAKAPASFWTKEARGKRLALEVAIRVAVGPHGEVVDGIRRAHPGVDGEHWYRRAGRAAKDAHVAAYGAAREAGYKALAAAVQS